MSHFYGYLQGNKGETTRCGGIDSGIHARIKSWKNDIDASLSDDDGDVLRLSIPIGLPTFINGVKVDISKITEQNLLLIQL